MSATVTAKQPVSAVGSTVKRKTPTSATKPPQLTSPNRPKTARGGMWPVIAIPPIRSILWKKVETNVHMLSPDRATNVIMNKYCGKSAAIAVAAIAFSHVYPINQWHPKDINNILDIGQYLHRTSYLRNKNDTKPLKPSDIIGSFYVDFTKLTTMLSASRIRGEFKIGAGSIGLVSGIHSMLADNVGCILCYDRVKYAAIWFISGSYYVFYCHENESQLGGHLQIRQSCCLRILTTDTLVNFLPRLLKPQGSKYSIVSMKILSVQELSKYPDENPVTEVERQWSDKSVSEVQAGPTMVQDIVVPSGGGDDEEILLDAFEVSPYLDNFPQAYVAITSGRDILRGFNFAEQSFRVPSMNVGALVLLRLTRSFTWTWDTLEEILALGHHIYEDNRSHTEGPDVLATDIIKPIQFGRSQFEIECSQAVFGELMSTGELIPDLERALELFFDSYDSGVLQGPQSVAIWHELGYYYMFDAKERDRFGRKWITSLANEYASDCPETVGCCCVSRFVNLSVLVNVYTETVPLKHRRDPFRITRVQVKDYRTRSPNWHDWEGIALGRWILRGKFCQANERFDEDRRDAQATCIAATAIVFTNWHKMDTWNSALVDEILIAGDVLHKQSVEKLTEQDKFSSMKLHASEICKYFEMKDNNVQIEVEECVINGSLQSQVNTNTVGLESGLLSFFNNNTYGILIACETSLAIWKNQDQYYVFDSHARDENGRNPAVSQMSDKNGKLGTSCVLRFSSLPAFSNFILCNFEQSNSTEFNISRIEMSTRQSDQSVPLKKYAAFNENSTIAILRPPKGLHEGNRKLFDLRNDKQTLCNQLVAMCMSNLNPSSNWSKKDLCDILSIGDKVFVRFTNQSDRVHDDFVVDWDHVLKSGIDIGNSKFLILDTERKDGVFVAPPPPEEEEEEEEDDEDDYPMQSIPTTGNSRGMSQAATDPKRGMSARKTGSKLERLSLSIPAGGDANTVNIDVPKTPSMEGDASVTSVPEYIPPDDLKSLFETFDKDDEFDVVLENALYTAAIWKQNKQYFFFDPKACDDIARLTEKRVKLYEHRIKTRKEEEAARAAEEAQRLLDEMVLASGSQVPSTENAEPFEVPAESVIQPVNDILIPNDEEEEGRESIVDEGPPPTYNDLKEIEESAVATCLLMRFTTLEELIEHILAGIPEEYQNEAISIMRMRLECQNIPAVSVHFTSFKVAADTDGNTYWMIRASMSQNDQIFLAHSNRNRQDVANCITALCMATFCSAEDWTSVILDVILKYGDRLYSKSIQQQQHQYDSEKLNLYQVISPFVLASVKFTFTVEFVESGDLTVKRGNPLVKSVIDVLEEFFNPSVQFNPVYGVLVARQYYVALWRDSNSFYMFDEHEIGPDGKPSPVGVACLFRFSKLSTMATMFVANLDPTIEFNSFQLYKIKIHKAKLPNTIGICPATETSDQKTQRIVDPKGNSSYQGCTTLRFLRGTMSERCPALRWHLNPPTACHAVAAIATSKEVNAEYWTPRVIDQILILGNDIFDTTLAAMDETDSFDPLMDTLRPQQVRKDFGMCGGRLHVHMEMYLFQKGVVNPRDVGEMSLRAAMSRFFNEFCCALIATDDMTVAVWRECGYFYLFNAQAIDETGMKARDDGMACVARYDTHLNVYKAIMLNVPKEKENEPFEVRRCDFTLTPVPKDVVLVREYSATTQRRKQKPPSPPANTVVEEEQVAQKAADTNALPTECPEMVRPSTGKPKTPKPSRKRPSCYHTFAGNKCMILRGSALLKTSHVDKALREKQSPALSIVALAMSCVENIGNWSGKTLDLIVRSALEIYRDACALHHSKSVALQQMPRKIVIGEVLVELSILSPTITDTDLDSNSLVEFFEQHTMAYVYLHGISCFALIRLLNQFYLFDPLPYVQSCPGAGSDRNKLMRILCPSVCVLHFSNLQNMLEYLLHNYLAVAKAEHGEHRFAIGPIKCLRSHPAVGANKDAASVRGSASYTIG